MSGIDRRAFLHRTLATGTPDAVLKDPAVISAYLGMRT